MWLSNLPKLSRIKLIQPKKTKMSTKFNESFPINYPNISIQIRLLAIISSKNTEKYILFKH